MQISTLEELFVHLLSDIYSAETQLTRALPELAEATTNSTLAQAFTSHLEETKGHVERINQLVKATPGLELTQMTCAAMEGLVEEGKEIIDEVDEGPVRDAGLIAAAQKVEHYEIATYGTLCTLAAQLGYSEAQNLLNQTLEEEKSADSKLTMIAENSVNEQAASE